MANEISRTFDVSGGRIVLRVKDSLDRESVHSLYVMGIQDIEAEVARILSDADAQAQELRDRMVAAGWVPNGN